MSESESLVCPNCSERSPAGYILCPYCGFNLTDILRQIQRRPVSFRERFSRIRRSALIGREFFNVREAASISKNLFREIGVNPDRLGVVFLLYFLSVAYSTRLAAYVVKLGFENSSIYHDLHFWFFLISPWLVGIMFLLLALFGWFLSSVFIWLVAKTLGGKASLRDTYSIVGYSLGPLIPASLVIAVLVIFLGRPIGTVSATTYLQYTIFDLLYIPFIFISVYHCGNGLQEGHRLNPTYSYLVSGGLAIIFIYLYIIPL